MAAFRSHVPAIGIAINIILVDYCLILVVLSDASLVFVVGVVVVVFVVVVDTHKQTHSAK